MPLIAPAKTLAVAVAFVAGSLAAMTAAMAHPHVFVDARAEIIFDGQGRISAVRNIWKFDEAFSAFAIQGLDKNHDGKLEASELAPLAKVNVTSLKRYDYFTYVISGPAKHPFLFPDKHHLEYAGSRLTLFFTLPLKDPVPVDGKATVEIFDPEYFVAFTFLKDHPVSLVNAPAGCTASYQPPHMLDASTMSALAAIPVAQHDLPPNLLNAAAALANVINVNCPGSAPAAVAQAQRALSPPVPALSPDDAAHTSSPPALTSDAVLESAKRSGAAVVQPTTEVLMASKAIGANERTRTFDATTSASPAPSSPNTQVASAPAGPVLRIRSEEEIQRAKQNAQAAGFLNPTLLMAAAGLLIAIAVCGYFLQRILTRAR